MRSPKFKFAVQNAEFAARRLAANLRYSRDAQSLTRGLRMALGEERFVVALSHSNYLRNVGGTELYLKQEQAFLAESNVGYVQLSPRGREHIEVNADGQPLGAHRSDDVRAALGRLRAPGRGCIAVHLHQLKGWDLGRVAAFATELGARRFRFFLHDYYSLCQNFNLLFGGATFCGAPPLESTACSTCRWGSGRARHMAEMRALLDRLGSDGGLELIAPSQAAADVFDRGFPEYSARVRVVPHQELAPIAPLVRAGAPGRPRLGFVGYSDRCKGFEEWVELSSHPEIRRRYQLFHFGSCGQPRGYVRNVQVNFQTGGAEAMRRALEEHQLDFAVLWSIWPETFSFTCFEAMSAGAYVLTGEVSGNVAAQVARTGRGRVFSGLPAVQQFLLDDAAVQRARGVIASLPRVRAVWVKSLSAELASVQ